jgi:hypothetical protein
VLGAHNVQLLQRQRVLRVGQVTNQLKHLLRVNRIAFASHVACRRGVGDQHTGDEVVVQQVAVVVSATLHSGLHRIHNRIGIQRHE